MTIALLGVMAMQYYYIRQSFHLKSQLFDESVMTALNTVALKAERNEALHFLNEKDKDRIQAWQKRAQVKDFIQQRDESEQVAERMRMKSRQLQSKFKTLEKEIRRRHPGAVLVDNDFYETYIKDPRYRPYVQYEASVRHEVDGYGGLLQQQDVEIYTTKVAPVIKKAKDDSVRYFIIDPNVGELIISLPPRVDERLEGEIRKYEQLAKARIASTYIDSIRNTPTTSNSAIENLANEFERSKQSLAQRIDSTFIVEQLKEELRARKLPLAFDMKISKGDVDSTLYGFVTDSSEKESQYSATLFPSETSANEATISVYFPGKSSILIDNIQMMLFSSATLLLILIGSFTYTILTILRQKKISEMKTDFINNMTHEFKTPVATIMIASESLKDPEIAEDKNRITRLANIIYDENSRLGNHIERVLNIARLEKDNLELTKELINVNDLLEGVVDSMELQFKKNEAEVSLDLKATRAMIMADELHLSNIIFNLLDNSLKYCEENAKIEIYTKNKGDHILIHMKDNGIGMSKEQQAKVFDQFYRVPTGNIHNVKGFGLGLSYVHDIVKRMTGSIKIKSELNKGTEFEITFPLNK